MTVIPGASPADRSGSPALDGSPASLALPWPGALVVAIVGAVFVAEGAYLVLILPAPAVGAGFALVGLAMPLLLGRSWPDRGRGYVAMVPALALGAAGYVALTLVYGFTSTL